MEELVTVEELKQHLRIEHDEEDTLLAIYRDGAISSIESHINRKIYKVLPSDPDIDDIELAPALKIAIFLYVGDLYNNRENTISNMFSTELPLGVAYLIAPFKHIN